VYIGAAPSQNCSTFSSGDYSQRVRPNEDLRNRKKKSGHPVVRIPATHHQEELREVLPSRVLPLFLILKASLRMRCSRRALAAPVPVTSISTPPPSASIVIVIVIPTILILGETSRWTSGRDSSCATDSWRWFGYCRRRASDGCLFQRLAIVLVVLPTYIFPLMMLRIR